MLTLKLNDDQNYVGKDQHTSELRWSINGCWYNGKVQIEWISRRKLRAVSLFTRGNFNYAI